MNLGFECLVFGSPMYRNKMICKSKVCKSEEKATDVNLSEKESWKLLL